MINDQGGLERAIQLVVVRLVSSSGDAVIPTLPLPLVSVPSVTIHRPWIIFQRRSCQIQDAIPTSSFVMGPAVARHKQFTKVLVVGCTQIARLASFVFARLLRDQDLCNVDSILSNKF